MARILLADDEEGLRLLMSRQLRRAGHEVIPAEDGRQAADLLDTQEFDVVLSDMRMPKMDGMGLLAYAVQVAPETEFIILTGHGSLENAVEAFKTGAVFDYLLKPLEDIRELDAVVARAVERRSLRRENTRLISELEARVADLEAARRDLADLADHDGLTGLFNHRAVHQRLDMLLAEDNTEPTSVILMDMDGFKLINDIYGHPMGDQVLRHLAGVLREICAPDSVLGRCGGDEFMAVLPATDAYGAAECAEAVRQSLIQHPMQANDGSRLPVRLCFGVADTNREGRSAASLVAAADAALYEGKHGGGDRVTLHLVDVSETDNKPTGQFDVLDSLVTTIDRKDRYTRRHSEDVTDHALLLVRALGLSDETFNAVRVAGLLHDIGKIGIPDHILRKPGKLTPDEYEVMKGHVALSALIIHGLPRLADILDAVAHHHERWDGRGYPNGLQGEDIPLLGRVMAIADAYSAMTMDRPYRAAMTLEEALEEIQKGSGTQFDPELAMIFIQATLSNTVALAA
jgi:diguanylate cyclase (GGDEF)-like protein/putative nucleotidyltransferase with HDIG domain